MEIRERIQGLATAYFNEVVNIRRHLHAHPELSMQEHKTAEYIATQLQFMGIPFKQGVARTGLVALIEGRNPEERLLALRADMDALPIFEENQADYKSKSPGIMHACGHDVHMASLLGAAKILHSLRDHFEGTIRLIFQPSEENYPGGASMMIKEGVLENPRPAAIFGQHVFPGLPAGKVGIRSGKYMASTDEIYLTVKGKGGHAATPHMVIDPVLMASHIVVALQQVVSRRAKPSMPTVLSFGRIIGEGRTNIIPAEVKLEGTIRTFDEAWRAQAHELIREIATSVARSMGGECHVFIDHGYPFLVNDTKLADNFRNWAGEYLGQENVEELELAMTAEDFAFYSQIVPACFYRLGIRNEEKGIVSNLHTSTFNIDEEALKTGMGLMAFLAIKRLEEQ
jgi:amidohydrolase